MLNYLVIQFQSLSNIKMLFHYLTKHNYTNPDVDGVWINARETDSLVISLSK